MSLENAKVGDKLLIYNRYNEYISAVTRITPSGRVVTASGDTFRPDGRRIGDSDHWRTTRARLATPEDLDRLRIKAAVYRLEHTQWATLPSATIDAVLALLAPARGIVTREGGDASAAPGASGSERVEPGPAGVRPGESSP